MQEIKCPNCGKMFQVDESGYAQIVKQVRDREFDGEIENRLHELSEKKEDEMRLSLSRQEKEFSQKIFEKNGQISELRAKLDAGRKNGELAVEKAVSAKELEKTAAVADKDKIIAEKEREITELKAQLSNKETEKNLAVSEAVSVKNKELSEKTTEINNLHGRLELKDSEMALSEKTLREKYEIMLSAKDEQINYYKDFKARQSTKMIGESLEQHCLSEFNSIRMTSFPEAYFEKDNDARTGSKGDFIFRESADGTEFISIMFEMKNEMDETATKHKNEDFFKELDKDRKEKKCEYAVLVSMLESDNEFYNKGIVDVSYKYPKMFVVRPQFFIPIISLLRNAARNSLEYQKKLADLQNQQIDLYNFEQNVAAFKDSFANSFRLAGERFEDAIKGIDDTINKLTKIRENLVKSESHLNTANNKLDDVSIKKLTKNAPSVKAMFEENKLM